MSARVLRVLSLKFSPSMMPFIFQLESQYSEDRYRKTTIFHMRLIFIYRQLLLARKKLIFVNLGLPSIKMLLGKTNFRKLALFTKICSFSVFELRILKNYRFSYMTDFCKQNDSGFAVLFKAEESWATFRLMDEFGSQRLVMRQAVEVSCLPRVTFSWHAYKHCAWWPHGRVESNEE